MRKSQQARWLRARAIEYAQQIAAGLAAAHEKGVVPRDLKPENLFVTKDGRVKILDFGLAKLKPQQNTSTGSEIATQKQLTMPGTVMGTVAYMSPEQVRGEVVDHRSDIFSFGLILYEMLRGERAFQRETMAETMTAILKDDPPELSAPFHPDIRARNPCSTFRECSPAPNRCYRNSPASAHQAGG